MPCMLAAPGKMAHLFAGTVGLAGWLAVWPALAQAQGPPINTQNAFVTGLNGAGFRSFFLSFDRSDLRLDGTQVTDPLDRQLRVRGELDQRPRGAVVVLTASGAALVRLGGQRCRGPGGRGNAAHAAILGVSDRPELCPLQSLVSGHQAPHGHHHPRSQHGTGGAALGVAAAGLRISTSIPSEPRTCPDAQEVGLRVLRGRETRQLR